MQQGERTGRQARKAEYFNQPQETVADKVTKAEIWFCHFLAKQNLPFSVGDSYTSWCKIMFPDGEIAKSFQWGHTKSAAIIKETLASHFKAPIVAKCQQESYTVVIDESNNRNADKNCAVMVRINEETGLKTHFLGLPKCNDTTKENILIYNAELE